MRFLSRNAAAVLILAFAAFAGWIAVTDDEDAPAPPTTTTTDEWGTADVPVDVGGDRYLCREMRWNDDVPAGLDLRHCELDERVEGERDGS